jgi:hypothetical protein
LEAVKAITSEAAWQYHHEDLKGTIGPGKLADFVILSDDPLSVGHLDPIVGAGDLSVPLADILRLEVRGISIWRSIGFGYLAIVAGGMAILGVACLDSPEDC